MGDENGDGAAYLAALKQSTKPQAAPAKPALATTTPAATQRRPSGAPASAATGSGHREKRQSPRYRCQGSVRLREIAGVAATWATVTDISMQGCYVEASASHRAGASLVLAIEISGFRVETTGEVRAAYPGLGMGISFVKMAEADRERLRQVISSLSASPVEFGSRVATPSLSTSPSDAPPSFANPAFANPSATLQAMMKFFESRHMMGREEFFRILRKS